MSVEFIVLMTGTPVQNNINELYSLLSLIDSNRFSLPGEGQFVAKYWNTSDSNEFWIKCFLKKCLDLRILAFKRRIFSIELLNRSYPINYHNNLLYI